jgi:hypothetical protein
MTQIERMSAVVTLATGFSAAAAIVLTKVPNALFAKDEVFVDICAALFVVAVTVAVELFELIAANRRLAVKNRELQIDAAHEAFIKATQSCDRYLTWEEAALETLYPQATFTLCGRRYVALRVETPSRFGAVRSGKNSLDFAELVSLKQPVYQGEESFTDQGESYLQYVTSDGGIVRYPDRHGFEPLRWNFDGSEPLVELGVNRFRDMVATGVPLQRELYDDFLRGTSPKHVAAPRRRELGLLKPELPIARSGFRPTLSVQALTIIVRDGVPRVITMVRSDEVAARQGWLQFPPSGALEVFGLPPEDDVVELRRHADPGASLRREFIEELFAVDEWQAANKETYDNLEVSPTGARLKSAFSSGAAEVRFLGVVADVVGMRGELSFLIVARDVDWEIKRGLEAKSQPTQKTFKELSELLSDPKKRVNPSSAALLRLAIDSGALADLGLITRESAAELFGASEASGPDIDAATSPRSPNV